MEALPGDRTDRTEGPVRPRSGGRAGTGRRGRPASGPRAAARAPLALCLLALAASGCGAPQSRAAGGDLGAAVEASLDSGTAGFDHAGWGRLLAEGTRDGLVDYPYFQRHRDSLDAYLERVAGADLARLAPAELEALLINAYNALTVRSILEHPDASSIREIDGVWTERRHRVGGHPVSLDGIEHNLLRPYFRDPRLHFALNCASVSCAPLPPWAFEGERLDEQLRERTSAFLRDTAHVRVDGSALAVSRYFDWYGGDFTAPDWEPSAPSIPAFVARYSRPEVASFVRGAGGEPPLRFLDYDWSLNAAVPPSPEVGGTEPAAGDDGAGWVAWLRSRVRGLGSAAPVAYAAAYVLAVVLFVPGAPLTIGAGVAFGLGLGTAVVAAAATTGAAIAFLLGRHLLRERVEGWVRGRPKLSAVDRAVEREGWRVVALTRLSPAFPFSLQNYFYGLTGVDFWPYVLASAVAMLPGTLLYVYIGAAGAHVASAATGAADWGRTALQVMGLLATVLVVLLVARVARRELEKATSEPAGDAGRPDGAADGGDGATVGRSEAAEGGCA